MASFTGFNIANTAGAGAVWRIYEGYTTPWLTFFLIPITVTANNDSKTYDGALYSGGNGVTYSTYSIANPNPNPALSGTLAYTGSSQAAVNVGAYNISPSDLYSIQQGYDISFADGPLLILPITITNLIHTETPFPGQDSNPVPGDLVLNVIDGGVLLPPISEKPPQPLKVAQSNLDAGKESIRIPNIQYEFNKAVILEKSKIAIDKTVLALMLSNPDIIVEIQSHTDSRGSDSYNQDLSQRRAESVVEYLKSKGISGNRLVPKGYGESKPIATNAHADNSDNPEGRAKNRRTDFKIIGKLDVEVINDATVE